MHRPLRRQRGLQAHDSRFGDVVRDLRLRVIHTMCADGGCKRDGTSSTRRRLLGTCHLSRCGLRAKKGARGVDVEGFAPLDVRHFQRVEAADDPGEAEQVVQAPQRVYDGFDAFRDARAVRDVYAYGEDALGWEVLR